MRKLAPLLLLLSGPALAAPAAEPSLCLEFNATLTDALARAPDSLQLNSLLFEAARKGCIPALQRVLQAGGSRLSRDREGDTALAIAAHAGREAVVKALLSGASGAEQKQIDMPDARGSTPLMLALHAGRPAVARALIEAGANTAAINAMGETALAEAAYGPDEDDGALLLSKGANPATVDRFGKSPICYAAARGATRLVQALLDAGVDVNARYGGDLTALMWAAGFSDQTRVTRAVETVKLLIAKGAKLDFADDRGRTALMIAAGLNRFETVKALLEAGADRTLRDKAGKTAADLAATDEMRAALR